MTSTVTCTDVYGKTHITPVSELQWRPAAYGTVIKDNKVLLLRQFGGTYDLPGGGLNLGEDPKDAVIREVKEETGIDVEEPVPLGIESSLFRSSHSDNKSYHSLLLYYSCRYAGGEPSTLHLEEIEQRYVDGAEWVPVEGVDSIKISIDFRNYIKKALTTT